MESFPITETRRQGLVEVENPTELLTEWLQQTPDYLYTEEELSEEGIARENLPSLLKDHREQIGKAIEQVKEISEKVALEYRAISEENGFAPQHIRIYLVGGRTRKQPFRLSSDLDTVITVDNKEEGLERQGERERDILRTKTKQDLWERLYPILAEFNLIERVDHRDASFWEIKGFGKSDNETRAQWSKSSEVEAVLLFDEREK